MQWRNYFFFFKGKKKLEAHFQLRLMADAHGCVAHTKIHHVFDQDQNLQTQ
jgi:hypothetical protein